MSTPTPVTLDHDLGMVFPERILRSVEDVVDEPGAADLTVALPEVA